MSDLDAEWDSVGDEWDATPARKKSTLTMRQSRSNARADRMLDDAKKELPASDTFWESVMGGANSLALGLTSPFAGSSAMSAVQDEMPGDLQYPRKTSAMRDLKLRLYRDAHDRQTDAQATADEDSPVGSGIVGPVVAGLATGVGGLASNAGKLAFRAPDAIARFAQGARAAAPISAATGAINSVASNQSGDAGQVAKNAAVDAGTSTVVGGGIGGGLATVAPAVARAGGAVVKAAPDIARRGTATALKMTSPLVRRSPAAIGTAAGYAAGGYPGATIGAITGPAMLQSTATKLANAMNAKALKLRSPHEQPRISSLEADAPAPLASPAPFQSTRDSPSSPILNLGTTEKVSQRTQPGASSIEGDSTALTNNQQRNPIFERAQPAPAAPAPAASAANAKEVEAAAARKTITEGNSTGIAMPKQSEPVAGAASSLSMSAKPPGAKPMAPFQPPAGPSPQAERSSMNWMRAGSPESARSTSPMRAAAPFQPQASVPQASAQAGSDVVTRARSGDVMAVRQMIEEAQMAGHSNAQIQTALEKMGINTGG